MFSTDKTHPTLKDLNKRQNYTHIKYKKNPILIYYDISFVMQDFVPLTFMFGPLPQFRL